MPLATVIDFEEWKCRLDLRRKPPEFQAEPLGYEPGLIKILSAQCQRGDDDAECRPCDTEDMA